jgi:hypothetical protein
MFKATQLLRDMGMKRNRSTTAKSNVASLKAFEPSGSKAYAEARYLKLLWWEFWKEKPINSEKGV